MQINRRNYEIEIWWGKDTKGKDTAEQLDCQCLSFPDSICKAEKIQSRVKAMAINARFSRHVQFNNSESTSSNTKKFR